MCEKRLQTQSLIGGKDIILYFYRNSTLIFTKAAFKLKPHIKHCHSFTISIIYLAIQLGIIEFNRSVSFPFNYYTSY